jgi:hypothetical protein
MEDNKLEEPETTLWWGWLHGWLRGRLCGLLRGLFCGWQWDLFLLESIWYGTLWDAAMGARTKGARLFCFYYIWGLDNDDEDAMYSDANEDDRVWIMMNEEEDIKWMVVLLFPKIEWLCVARSLYNNIMPI